MFNGICWCLPMLNISSMDILKSICESNCLWLCICCILHGNVQATYITNNRSKIKRHLGRRQHLIMTNVIILIAVTGVTVKIINYIQQCLKLGNARIFIALPLWHCLPKMFSRDPGKFYGECTLHQFDERMQYKKGKQVMSRN